MGFVLGPPLWLNGRMIKEWNRAVLCGEPWQRAANSAPRIGVFDSGVGGLTVLRALCRCLPQAAWFYVADSAHAPYGERSDAYVLDRSMRLTRYLVEEARCIGVVVACNTATAVAVAALRARWPSVPMVGVEPGVKPAVAQSRAQRIGVMATPATLRHPRFQALVTTYAATATVVAVPCPGLAWAIEQGHEQAPAVGVLLDRFCAELRAHQVDAVVLGCTHYAFVLDQIRARVGPDVVMIDTADAVARHAAQLLGGHGVMDGPHLEPPLVQLFSTGERTALGRMAASWLGQSVPVCTLGI
jgi:glutamate racemase